MMNSYTIKKNAKQALKQRWSTAIGVLLTQISVFLFSTYVLGGTTLYIAINCYKKLGKTSGMLYDIAGNLNSYIPAIIMLVVYLVVNFLVMAPIVMGAQKWHYDLACGKDPRYNTVFYFFKTGSKFLKSISININLFFRKLLWAIALLLLPTILCFGINFVSKKINENGGVNIVGLILLFIIFVLIQVSSVGLVFLYSAHINKYFMAKYLLCRYGDITSANSVKVSIDYMQGYTYNLFWFRVSFLLWVIFTLALLPVALYTVPYYNTALAQYAKSIEELAKTVQ